jgi:nicotinamidase/pyrazinamidase
MPIQPKSVLLVVDMQNDFLPGGALAVPDGDTIVPVINDYIHLFIEADMPVIATRDWHPPETVHFRSGGGNWPAHCIAGTEGAEFAPDLELPDDVIVMSKGMDPSEDGYSAFLAQDEDGRSLEEILDELGVEHIYIAGLALDYCVKASARDAQNQGRDITVLIDATRAVNQEIHDAEETIEELVRKGGVLATLEHVRA